MFSLRTRTLGRTLIHPIDPAPGMSTGDEEAGSQSLTGVATGGVIVFVCDGMGPRHDEDRSHIATGSETGSGWKRLKRISFPGGEPLSFYGVSMAAVGDDGVAIGSWHAIPETSESLLAPPGSARSAFLRPLRKPSDHLRWVCSSILSASVCTEAP